jgi:calcineurin-like phosphoesterase
MNQDKYKKKIDRAKKIHMKPMNLMRYLPGNARVPSPWNQQNIVIAEILGCTLFSHVTVQNFVTVSWFSRAGIRFISRYWAAGHFSYQDSWK